MIGRAMSRSTSFALSSLSLMKQQPCWASSDDAIISKSLKGNLTKIDFATDKIGIGVGGRFIYKTSDGGHKWKIVYESPQSSFSYVDVLDSLNIWVTGHDSLYKSVDGGNSWFSFKLNNSIQQMRGIQFLNSTVGIVSEVRENTSDTTFNYVTADGGSSWKKHTINDIQFVSSFNKMKFTDPEHLWFANQYGVWMSKDTAKTWKLIPVEDAYQSFDFIDSLNGWLSIWGGQFKKMAYTTNGGISWETVDKPYSIQTTDVLMYKDYFGTVNTLVAGYDGSLINFIQGDSYSYEIPTYTTNTLQSFAFNKKGNVLHMWAAGDGMTVLHYSVVVTDVKEESPQKISSYCLSQNYPNPFNPSTQIKYQLPQKGFVTLRVYDVLGREVAALVNEQKDPGSYSVQWNASRFASGVYFARLQSGSKVLLKKMNLLR